VEYRSADVEAIDAAGLRKVLGDASYSPTTRNDAANRLLRERDPRLAGELIRMLNDETEDLTWRNYCVQFLRSCYEQDQQPEVLKALEDTCQHKLPELSSCALWGLAQLAVSRPWMASVGPDHLPQFDDWANGERAKGQGRQGTGDGTDRAGVEGEKGKSGKVEDGRDAAGEKGKATPGGKVEKGKGDGTETGGQKGKSGKVEDGKDAAEEKGKGETGQDGGATVGAGKGAGATAEAGKMPARTVPTGRDATKHAEAPFENPLDRPLLPAESDTKARALALAWLGDDKGHLLTRTAGAQSCSRMGVKDAAPKLRELAAAAAEPISLRVVCIAGLAQLGDQESRPLLEALANDKSQRVRQAAEMALKKLTARSHRGGAEE
jgi:hypothetical protein